MSDKYSLETTIFLPKNFNKGKKYPGLIYIHGGPNTFETMTIGNLISARGQSVAVQLCQQGFVVAIPNYRGTRGYGSKHLEKVPKFSMEYANFVFEDVINLVEMLINKYKLDKNRIGLYGSSYGAQITGWIISNCYYFKVAAGIIGVRYDEDAYSIESRVPNINCPLLIVETGLAEGKQKAGKKLYKKLLSFNKVSEYYIYPKAFHNGGWNDKYKKDYMFRIINFFKKYLMQE